MAFYRGNNDNIVRTLNAKFQGRCTVCGSYFPVGTLIYWSKAGGAKHTVCPNQELKAIPVLEVNGHQVALDEPTPENDPIGRFTPPVNLPLAGIFAFIDAARARGLKRPGARFLAPGNEEMRLYISGAKSKVPGSLQVLVRDKWVGRVLASGEVHGQVLKDDGPLQDTLLAIAADPAAAAKAYGALFCRCSFCSKSLEDDGSVEVGYGPVCAKHYGLPHKAKGVRNVGVQA